MLSFEERLELFKKELAETSPEDTLAELRSYEAKGPLASSFLEGTKSESEPKYRYEKVDFEKTIEVTDDELRISSDLYLMWSESNVVPINRVTVKDLVLNRQKLCRRIEVTERDDFINRCEDIKKAVGDAPHVYFGMIYDELVKDKQELVDIITSLIGYKGILTSGDELVIAAKEALEKHK